MPARTRHLHPPRKTASDIQRTFGHSIPIHIDPSPARPAPACKILPATFPPASSRSDTAVRLPAGFPPSSPVNVPPHTCPPPRRPVPSRPVSRLKRQRHQGSHEGGARTRRRAAHPARCGGGGGDGCGGAGLGGAGAGGAAGGRLARRAGEQATVDALAGFVGDDDGAAAEVGRRGGVGGEVVVGVEDLEGVLRGGGGDAAGGGR